MQEYLRFEFISLSKTFKYQENPMNCDNMAAAQKFRLRLVQSPDQLAIENTSERIQSVTWSDKAVSKAFVEESIRMVRDGTLDDQRFVSAVREMGLVPGIDTEQKIRDDLSSLFADTMRRDVFNVLVKTARMRIKQAALFISAGAGAIAAGVALGETGIRVVGEIVMGVGSGALLSFPNLKRTVRRSWQDLFENQVRAPDSENG
jgi:hypothetical protein